MESVLEQKYNMMGFYHNNDHHRNDEDTYVISEDDEATSSLSSFDGSNISKESSSSSELLDDASSSSSSPRSPNGPLYGLSELMDQLPIKRGLSKFYQGKSQSFTSLARATSLEDLAKKESPYQRRLKACRSYAGGLNNFRSKGAISKKVSSNYKGSSLSNLSCLSRKNSFIITSCRPPLNPRTVQNLFE